MEFLTTFNFFLGIATVLLSSRVAYRFHSYQKRMVGRPKKISKAISWQLLGEAVIGFGTLVFATAAHYGWLQHWPEIVQSSIRFCMFFATSATTWHLLKRLKDIESELK